MLISLVIRDDFYTMFLCVEKNYVNTVEKLKLETFIYSMHERSKIKGIDKCFG